MAAKLILVLLAVVACAEHVTGACSPQTRCFGHGDFDSATQTCKCFTTAWSSPYGPFTGECCESINCKSPNATCKHGYCGADGATCERCQNGWAGADCDNATSCFPWFNCKRGKCVQSRFLCDCEPGWVGDHCDRSLCAVNCVYGACPHDPNTCECYGEFQSPETGCDRAPCADGWQCLNGGYCVAPNHCVCPPFYTGEHCETVASCNVSCVHGRCSSSPNKCDCETNWQGPACTEYVGTCNNCSSTGGTCSAGPDTCQCKPGYTGPTCAVQSCSGCEHGSCALHGGLKHCTCDYGWLNQAGTVPGFEPGSGPCNVIWKCVVPCVHGQCPSDPYKCVCTPPYQGAQCDVIKCPVCCPPEVCDCSNPNAIKCRPTWHHVDSCCLVLSCFRGDTMVQTSKGLVPIEDVKVGDMVITRHEGDDAGVTYFRRVDQVRKRFVSRRDLVVIQTPSQDIWATSNHPFYDETTRHWVAAGKLTTASALHAVSGKPVKLRGKILAPQLTTDSGGEGQQVVPVYDLSVEEYDRYAVGKEGLLAASCNDTDSFQKRDKQVWGEAGHPLFASEKKTLLSHETREEQEQPAHQTSDQSSFPIAGVVVGAVLACALLPALVAVVFKRYQRRKVYRQF